MAVAGIAADLVQGTHPAADELSTPPAYIITPTGAKDGAGDSETHAGRQERHGVLAFMVVGNGSRLTGICNAFCLMFFSANIVPLYVSRDVQTLTSRVLLALQEPG
jgi:hypothetical protein